MKPVRLAAAGVLVAAALPAVPLRSCAPPGPPSCALTTAFVGPQGSEFTYQCDQVVTNVVTAQGYQAVHATSAWQPTGAVFSLPHYVVTATLPVLRAGTYITEHNVMECPVPTRLIVRATARVTDSEGTHSTVTPWRGTLCEHIIITRPGGES